MQENACKCVTIGFDCTFDWMKKWCKSFKPIVCRRKCKTNYFLTLKIMKTALPVTNLTNNQLVWKNKRHQRKLLLMLRLYTCNLKWASVMISLITCWLLSWASWECSKAINIDIFHCLMQVKFCAAERSVEPPASEMWHSQISIPKCLWYSNAIASVVFVKIYSRYSHAPFC